MGNKLNKKTWMKQITFEYAELRQKQNDEVKAETQAAFKLAKERGERFKKQLDQ